MLLPTWFLVPFAIVAVLGLIGGAVLDIYSSGLALLSLGLRVPRYVAALIDGTVMTLGTIYVVFIAGNFFGQFEGFLITLGVPIAAWCGVMLADIALRRRDYSEAELYNPSGRYGDIRWFPVGVVIVSTVIGWGLVTNSLASWLTWQGYLLGPFGLGGKTGAWAFANLGVLVALVIGFVVHLDIRPVGRTCPGEGAPLEPAAAQSMTSPAGPPAHPGSGTRRSWSSTCSGCSARATAPGSRPGSPRSWAPSSGSSPPTGRTSSSPGSWPPPSRPGHGAATTSSGRSRCSRRMRGSTSSWTSSPVSRSRRWTATTFGKVGDELSAILGGGRMVLAGVSTDCCVLSTALAAADDGVEVQVVADACAGIDDESHAKALDIMRLYSPLVEVVGLAEAIGQAADSGAAPAS